MVELILLKLFFKTVTVITAESIAGLEYFTKRFNPPFNKFVLLPNGVDLVRIYSMIDNRKSFDMKENIILSVGRIGSNQKNNELLMTSIASLNDISDWKVFFVGPLENGFDKVISNYFEAFPHLRDKVIFVGAIDNPLELYEYYNRSKVFCLTSRFEGFPLVCCEAAFFGNYQLLSDTIFAFDTITDYGKNGKSFNLTDSTSLACLLNSIIINQIDLSVHFESTINYASENLTWQANIKKLSNFI